jgi:hypothetical protein
MRSRGDGGRAVATGADVWECRLIDLAYSPNGLLTGVLPVSIVADSYWSVTFHARAVNDLYVSYVSEQRAARQWARIDGESGGARMKYTEAVAGQAALR